MELYLWEGKSEWVACCKQIGFYKLGWCAILWVNCCSCPCPFTKRRRAWFERQHHLSPGLRLQSCWMKSCSPWSSVLPSADRYILAVKIRPVSTGHILFTVITFLCMDDFKLLQMENVNIRCMIAPVPVLLCSMLPLFVKDGLLVPYVVTLLAFLSTSIRLLSALERCSEAELRLGAYRKLLFCLPKLDLACIVRWKVSVMFYKCSSANHPLRDNLVYPWLIASQRCCSDTCCRQNVGNKGFINPVVTCCILHCRDHLTLFIGKKTLHI